ncbi:mitochondrial outer membrane import complex protein METAXIN [Telopea speciosissima]|uniref:mitochondrial outer membrane import complex protein METAXIN n=1 Tax=Telopea speciosissima TaxID=54955 RepID=UPI001CC50877|nr:mitochondrial outer membrane import complex protein METAXIN [Telopea speciosissima]XP_043720207.1 mitochondrial outer membrane import complex protein METAXIN [Telopea speciosissima]
MDEEKAKELVLVARKACFGLPTACPSCLPVYFYLRFADVAFDLQFNVIRPDADQIPYVEYGNYVAYNNENGGAIETLKEDGIVDLDSGLPSHTIPEWVSIKAMISSWLDDAVVYELWVGSDGSTAHKIYYSDLPWPIGKILYFKQVYTVKQLLGITKVNTERREAEIYRRASIAYEALSTRLGEQTFFFENRPTSLDAIFLGHALFVTQALPDTSVLRSKLLGHSNLIRYIEKFKMEFLEAGSLPSSLPRQSPFEPSSSSTPRRGGPSSWSSKPNSKPKREKTEEEKTFRRRAKYFLAAQCIAVLVFLSLMGGSDGAEVEIDDDDDGLNYEE